MDVNLHNQRGEKIGTVNLPDSIFKLPINQDLLHQVVISQMANQRQVIAHTKDRSEVSGGGKKPWRQKGTGRARHGSIRSPIWKGGGVTFGPRNEKSYKKKINRKMAASALLMALSSKVKDHELIVVDSINLSQPKTKEMAQVIKSLKSLFDGKGGQTLVVVPKSEAPLIFRASSNLPSLDVRPADQLSALDVLAFKHLVFLEGAVMSLQKPQA